jgi:hypothetical protein
MKQLLIGSLFAIMGVAAHAVTFGNTSPFETQSTHAPDYVLGVQVSITTAGTLDSFGMMYGSPGHTQSTANAEFALYDNAGASGLPLHLLASTSQVTLSGTQTFDDIAFTTHPNLVPGTYWMMALYQSTANPRVGATNNTSSLVAYWSEPYASGFNAVAPTVTTYTGQDFNYWVNMTPVPEPSSLALAGLSGLLAWLKNKYVRRGEHSQREF